MFDVILSTNSFESVLLEKAFGSWFWDVSGKKYLDCVSGTWSVNLGHNHPVVVQALKDQMEKMLHRCMRFQTPITLEAAEKLLRFLPQSYEKTTFLNSGSEAVEVSINFAIRVTKKTKILSMKDSYLGAYGLARESSYTTQQTKLKIPYPTCEANDCSCKEETSELIDFIISNYKSDLACFALEPIMVSGGIHKPCSHFINELCTALQEEGILIVANEVTCGFGRTGFRFGHQHFDIKPDIIAIGKALGNGYPVSAVVTTEKIESSLTPAELYHAQSHQSDPLGASAVKAVVNIFEKEQVIAKSIKQSRSLAEFLSELQYPFIKETRNYGMLFAIEIEPYNSKTIDNIIIRIKDEMLKAGVLVGYSTGKKLIRLLPPINISEEEIMTFKNTFDKVLKKI